MMTTVMSMGRSRPPPPPTVEVEMEALPRSRGNLTIITPPVDVMKSTDVLGVVTKVPEVGIPPLPLLLEANVTVADGGRNPAVIVGANGVQGVGRIVIVAVVLITVIEGVDLDLQDLLDRVETTEVGIVIITIKDAISLTAFVSDCVSICLSLCVFLPPYNFQYTVCLILRLVNPQVYFW